MRHLVPLVWLFIVCGCDISPAIEKGRYVNQNSGFIYDINFTSTHAHFQYLFVQMSGKYEVSEGYLYIYAGGELGTLSFNVISPNELEGEGWAGGHFVHVDRIKEMNKDKLGEYITTSELNIREKNSEFSDVLYTLEKGELINAIEILEEDWYKIKYKDIVGYVSSKYIKKK